MASLIRVLCITALATLSGCGSGVNAKRSNDAHLSSSTISCPLPALTEAQVLVFARNAFGPGFDPPPGLPPPNRRVEAVGCRYKYTQSIVYDNRYTPSSLDGIDTTRAIYISRDGTSSDW